MITKATHFIFQSYKNINLSYFNLNQIELDQQLFIRSYSYSILQRFELKLK